MLSSRLFAPAAALLLLAGCEDDSESEYRERMRELVQAVSAYARGLEPGFIVVPQNGHELLTRGGDEEDPPAQDYLKAISGVGREDLLYGYDKDDAATPAEEREQMTAFLDLAEKSGVEALVTNYCSTRGNVDLSYSECERKGYASFAADHRELDDIPAYPASPYRESAASVTSLAQAKNFLYLLNTKAFADKDSFLAAVRKTNFDAAIIDLYYKSTNELSQTDVASLRVKANGGKRLLLAYMSIGEAEDYRYYWKTGWEQSPPDWLAGENPFWPGNYKVKYWDPAWQQIIFGSDSSYLKKIITAGFDGVYLDIIDAFEYFED